MIPVTQGIHGDNEIIVYSYLRNTIGFNIAISCGILACIYHESGFDHLIKGDYIDGKYTSFGLLQWHDGDRSHRWTNLLEYCGQNGAATVQGQLSFLKYELDGALNNAYLAIKDLPDTVEGSAEASYNFCHIFGGGTPAQRETRAQKARDTYYPHYLTQERTGGNTTDPAPVSNLGLSIVEIAEAQINDPYKTGAAGPDLFDDAGLVYYSYKEAGKNIGSQSTDGYYSTYSGLTKVIVPGGECAGDLLFYGKSPTRIVAIADGAGGRIYASEIEKKVVKKPTIGNPSAIMRVLSDSQTSRQSISSGEDEGTGDSESPDASTPVTSGGLNLSETSAVGYDFYGYLIDNTHGGTFKFYIPEFSESAGAEWDNIVITGRSVNVIAYKSTDSRKVDIELDLYAGAGIYEIDTASSGDTDIVGKMHRDVNFIKSLEYPDYSNPITRPPSTVTLMLGSAFKLIGVVSGVKVNHLKPLDEQNRAMYLKVSFTVTQTAINPPDYKDIQNGLFSLPDTYDLGSYTDDLNAPPPGSTDPLGDTPDNVEGITDYDSCIRYLKKAGILDSDISRIMTELEYMRDVGSANDYQGYIAYLKYMARSLTVKTYKRIGYVNSDGTIDVSDSVQTTDGNVIDGGGGVSTRERM